MYFYDYNIDYSNTVADLLLNLGKAKVQKVQKLAKHSVKQRETTAIGWENAHFAPPPLVDPPLVKYNIKTL